MKWFISDTMLGSKSAFAGERKESFKDVHDWSHRLVDEINSTVPKHDALFIVGDFAPCNVHYWRKQIHVHDMYLIVGDRDASIRECESAFGSRKRVFRSLLSKMGSYKCWLSHFPHAFWPESDRGSFHLYGHLLGKHEKRLDRWMPERRSIDVSPESLLKTFGSRRPVNEFELLNLLKNRNGHESRFRK